MSETITLSGGESAVTISGLSSADKISTAAFDGITVTMTGAAVDNFSDLLVTGGGAGGKNGVRRIIWKGKVDGVERNAVLIIDTFGSGKLRGGWLIFGAEQNHLTYYTDSTKLTAKSTGSVNDAAAEISLQFFDKEAALKPRTFTFVEKHSLLSLGSAFDNVTISGSAHGDVYLSRTLKDSSKLNGVIKCGDTAIKNSGEWKFSDANSFVVETSDDGVKFYSRRDD